MSETVFFTAADKRSIVVPGLAADKTYTVQVRAYRRVDADIDATGVIRSPVVTADPYQPVTEVAFDGDLTGTIQGRDALSVVVNLENIASDSVLSTTEKPSLILEYSRAVDELAKLDAKATSLGGLAAEQAAATAAQTSLDNYLATLTPAWNNTTLHTPIDRAAFTAEWAAFYSAIADLSTAIQGTPGETGPQGPAIEVVKSPGDFTFVNGALSPTSQTITFTATLHGVSGTINWTTSPNIKSGTGTTFTINNTEMGANAQVNVTATVGSVSRTVALAKAADPTARPTPVYNQPGQPSPFEGALWFDGVEDFWVGAGIGWTRAATVGAKLGTNFKSPGDVIYTRAAIETAEGVAAGIANQGAFATVSSVGYGSSFLTGFGSLAPREDVYFGSNFIREASGGAQATLTNFKTPLGIAAGFTGQGPLATKSSVNLASGEVTNKSLANLDSAANSKLTFVDQFSSQGGALNVGWKTDDLTKWYPGFGTGKALGWSLATTSGFTSVSVLSAQADAPVGTSYIRIVDNDDTGEQVFSEAIEVDPTKTYRISVWLRQTGDRRNYIAVAAKDAAGANIQANANDGAGWVSRGTYHYFGLISQPAPANFTQYEILVGPGGQATLPTGTKSVHIGMLTTREGPTGTNTTLDFCGFKIEEVIPNPWALIADPAGTKPADNADVTGANIAAGFTGQGPLATQASVTANQIDATIGGGNLIPDSSFENGWSVTSSGHNCTRTLSTDYARTGTRSLKLTSLAAGSGDIHTFYSYANVANVGDLSGPLTASAYVYSPVARDVYFRLVGRAGAAITYNADDTTTAGIVTLEANRWTRIVVSLPPKADRNGYYLRFGFIGPVSTNDVIYFDDMQLEVGDVVSAYSPRVAESWSDLVNRPTELTDGRIAAGLNASGDVVRNLPASVKTQINLDQISDGSTNRFFLNTEKTKLTGVETGANVTETRISAGFAGQGPWATFIDARATTDALRSITTGQDLIVDDFAYKSDAELNAVWTNHAGGGAYANSYDEASIPGGQYIRIGDNFGNDQWWGVRKQSIPFDPNALYEVEFWVKRPVGTGLIFLGLAGLAGNRTTFVNQTGADSISSQHYIAASSANPGNVWTRYVGYVKGTAASGSGGVCANPSAPGKMHSATRYIAPLILVNYVNTAGQTDIGYCRVRKIDQARLGSMVTREDGSTAITDADAITSQGIAAGFTGQGSLATRSDVSLDTHVLDGVTYKRFSSTEQSKLVTVGYGATAGDNLVSTTTGLNGVGSWSGGVAASTDVPAAAPAGDKSIEILDGSTERPGYPILRAGRYRVRGWVKTIGQTAGDTVFVIRDGTTSAWLASPVNTLRAPPGLDWAYYDTICVLNSDLKNAAPAWDVAANSIPRPLFYDLRFERMPTLSLSNDLTETDFGAPVTLTNFKTSQGIAAGFTGQTSWATYATHNPADIAPRVAAGLNASGDVARQVPIGKYHPDAVTPNMNTDPNFESGLNLWGTFNYGRAAYSFVNSTTAPAAMSQMAVQNAFKVEGNGTSTSSVTYIGTVPTDSVSVPSGVTKLAVAIDYYCESAWAVSNGEPVRLIVRCFNSAGSEFSYPNIVIHGNISSGSKGTASGVVTLPAGTAKIKFSVQASILSGNNATGVMYYSKGRCVPVVNLASEVDGLLPVGNADASLRNVNQQWSDVSGAGRPADNADVTGSNIAAGFTGQTSWATYATHNPADIAPRVAAGLNASGDVVRNLPSSVKTQITLDQISDGSTNRFYTAGEKTKLTGVETGANVTETRIAAGFTGQGSLATKDSVTLRSSDVIVPSDTHKNMLPTAAWRADMGSVPPSTGHIPTPISNPTIDMGRNIADPAAYETLMDVGPGGTRTLVLRSKTLGSGTSTGYAGMRFTIGPEDGFDPAQSYRILLWMRRPSGSPTTTYWFGAGNCFNLSGTANTNPYFASLSSGPLALDKWYLMVGILHASGYAGGDLGFAGLYDPATGERVAGFNEFRIDPQYDRQVMRFFSQTNIGTAGAAVMDWAMPVMEPLVNATPLEQLFATRGADLAFNVTNRAWTNLYRANGTTPITDGDAITSLGIAAGFTGQGPLATKSSVNLASSEVTNKSLANLDSTANSKLNGIEAGATLGATYGTNIGGLPGAIHPLNLISGTSLRADFIRFPDDNVTVSSRKPAEAGANITETRVAAGFTGQGPLATKSSVAWGSEITGIPEQRIYRNLLDNSTWVVGSTGSQTNFWANGTANEQEIVVEEGPSGSTEVVWKSTSQGDNSSDGGWNAPFNIPDAKKSYRTSVFMKQTSSNGAMYLGCSQANTNNLNGTANTNPYFWHDDLPQLNKWYLVVGIIHGSDYTGPNSGVSGVYDPVTGQRVVVGNDFKNKPGVTSQMQRVYQYYTTAPTTAYFARPRADLIDGNEPTLESLMKPHALLGTSVLRANGNVVSEGDAITAEGIAAGFTGQTSWATYSTHNPADIAPRVAAGLNASGDVVRNLPSSVKTQITLDQISDGSTNRFYTAGEKTKLTGVETGANITETRIAAGFTGQGPLATKSSVNLASSEVTNKSLANLDPAADISLGEARSATPVLPWRFDEDGKYFYAYFTGTPAVAAGLAIGSGNSLWSFVDDATYGRVAQTSSSAQYIGISPIGVIEVKPGRVYKASAAFRTTTGTRTAQLYLIGLDSAYGYVGYSGQNIQLTATTTWQSAEVVMSGDALISAGVRYVRNLSRTGPGTDTDPLQIAFCRVEDITEADAASKTSTWSGVSGAGKPDDNADVTGANTAAAIAGQGPGATAPANDVLNYRDEGNVGFVKLPAGAAFSGGSVTTGAFRIELPTAWTNVMIRFTVDIYNYSTGKMLTYMVGGYTYAGTGSGGYWIAQSVNVLGDSASAQPVYFGGIGGNPTTKPVIWIGTPTSTWNWTSVRVRDVVTRHGLFHSANFNDGWAITPDTATPANAGSGIVPSVLQPTSGDMVFGLNAKESYGGSVATLPNFKTSQGIAAGFTGQGPLASKSSVNLASSEVTNKSLANLDSTANTKLSGIEAGADVTANAQRSIVPQFPVIEIKQGEAGNSGNRTVTHTAKKGTTTLTGGTWSLPSTNLSGGSASISSSTGTVTLSSIAASGAYTVRYTHTDGAVTELPVNVTYIPTPSAGVGSSASSITKPFSSTSFVPISNELTIALPSGVTTASLLANNIMLEVPNAFPAGTTQVQAQWQRETSPGTWSNIGTAVSASPHPGVFDEGGFPSLIIGNIAVNNTVTGLTAGSTQKFRLVARVSGGTTRTVTPFGSVTVGG